MHNHKKILYVCLAVFLSLSVCIPASFAQLKQKPEKVTSLETTKAIKDVYRVVRETLKSLEYKIKDKKRNAYLYGFKPVVYIQRVELVDRSGNLLKGRGFEEDFKAEIWLEQTAEGKVLASLHVLEKDYQLNPPLPPTSQGESKRNEYEEKEILQKIEENLGKIR